MAKLTRPMPGIYKEGLRPSQVAGLFLLHFLLFALLYAALFQLGELREWPGPHNLIKWDAGFYLSIQEHGYIVVPEDKNNLAFFPLFPWLWQMLAGLGVGVAGVCLLNFLLFLAGLFLLSRAFLKPNIPGLLLYLSVPSTLFFVLPFSEAAFFFSSSLFLAALFRENLTWAALGIFLAALARPSAVFFFPALMFVTFMEWRKGGSLSAVNWQKLISLSAALGLGFLAVILFQWAQTGEWLAFWKVREEKWGNGFRWPALPLSTWDGSRLMWLDGLAFTAASISLLFVLMVIVRPKWPWLKPLVRLSGPFNFSAAYLALLCLFVLFFQTRDEGGGANLMAMNRYVLATPFFAVLFFRFWELFPEIPRVHLFLGAYLFLMLLLFGTFLPSNLPNHLRTAAYFLLLFAGAWAHHERKWNWMWMVVYAVNLGLAAVLLNKYLSGGWIG